jgi:hypothetical protein
MSCASFRAGASDTSFAEERVGLWEDGAGGRDGLVGRRNSTCI